LRGRQSAAGGFGSSHAFQAHGPASSADDDRSSVNPARQPAFVIPARPSIELRSLRSIPFPALGSHAMAGKILNQPLLCWLIATAVLVGWHLPHVFELAMQSEVWHAIESISFLAAGILFWMPVIPLSTSKGQWPAVVYSGIPFLGDVTVRCAVSISYVLWSRGLPSLSSPAATSEFFSSSRSGSRGRSNVGFRDLCLLDSSRRCHDPNPLAI